MSQYIVTNEGEAENVCRVVVGLTHSEPSESLPKRIQIFVPSGGMKEVLSHMINQELKADPEAKNQRFLMGLQIICPGDGDDSGPTQETH